MKDFKVIDTLKAIMKSEISNEMIFGDTEVEVLLLDGTKAKITTKK